MLAGMATIGSAVPAVATTQDAWPCGYFEEAGSAYYNHCGPTTIEIRVDRNFPLLDQTWCVYPDITRLGTASNYNFAWYTGGAGCTP